MPSSLKRLPIFSTLIASMLLLHAQELVAAGTRGQVQTFTNPSVIEAEGEDKFFEDSEANSAIDQDMGKDDATLWNDMVEGSFGAPGDEVSYSETSDSTQAPKRELLDIQPPVDATTRLIEESSLPLEVVFGRSAGNALPWPKGNSWLTGKLPLSRTYQFKGCKFYLKTGPVSIAHYAYDAAQKEYYAITDSARPMTTLSPDKGTKELYLGANVDLYPDVDKTTLAACDKSLRGRIIAIGKFDLSHSTIALKQNNAPYTIVQADRTPAKQMQVYLYWPAKRAEPLLIDDHGLYPLLSTPIYKVGMSKSGRGLLEVIPHLSYAKGGKALPKARLQEFWGE